MKGSVPFLAQKHSLSLLLRFFCLSPEHVWVALSIPCRGLQFLGCCIFYLAPGKGFLSKEALFTFDWESTANNICSYITA